MMARAGAISFMVRAVSEDVANSAIDVAFVAENYPGRDDKSLSVWSERVVVALPEDHPLVSRDIVHWSELRHEALLLPQRGPGPEFLNLLVNKVGHPDPRRLLRHDVGLDRLLTLVGAGWGILLALEGATGAVYPGVTYRDVHDTDGPTRLAFRAYWRQANCNPSLLPFLDMLRERYPDLSGAFAPSRAGSRRALANARSVAMNRSIIGAISLAGSGTDWPVVRPRTSA
jgi:DNA-binding transcriptional LysR family regulator